MKTIPEDIIPLLSDIDSGALVLTPNHRISFQLLDWYGQYKFGKNQPSVCPSPWVYPVDIWVRHQSEVLINQASPILSGKTLLEPVYESLIWHNILSESDSGSVLLNASATARAAQEAWTLTRLWQISDNELNAFSSSRFGQSHDDLNAYLGWAKRFAGFCQEKDLLTLVQVLESLITAIEAGAIELPDKILFYGFDNPPPLYAKFIAVIKNCANDVIQLAGSGNNSSPPQIKKHAFEDAETELKAASRWAFNTQQENPQATIAIIIPDLYSRQSLVKRIFSRCFTPLECNTLQQAQNSRYAISANTPLKQLPIIKAALLFLARNRFSSTTLDTCLFLRSVFLTGAVEEENARAELEKRFRDRNEIQINNADLRSLSKLEGKAYYAPIFSEALNRFDLAPKPSSKKFRSTRQWSAVFEQQLDALGWPGNRHSSTEDKAALKMWFQVLADFSCLSNTFGQITIEHALELLNRLAENTALRHGSPDASVQVLTPTEAAGLQFSHCWMTGLSEQQWPPTPKPSPFIPYALQKNKHIPEADISLYTELMAQTLAQLTASTREQIIFSYPAQNAEIELKPAAMLRHISGEISPFVNAEKTHASGEETISEANLPLHPLAFKQLDSSSLELFTEENVITLKSEESITGGSALISDQAECPFRSFVKHRLKTNPLEKLVTGLSARAAGSLVHLTLELFWKNLKSQSDLANTESTRLNEIIVKAIDTAIRETRKFYPNIMTEEFCRLEKVRLEDLLVQWLEEELKRGSFTVIAREHETTWQHAGLSLKLRIDRIDLTKDNKLVLVDYKTSKNISVIWEDERPANPQLMLYTSAVKQNQLASETSDAVSSLPVTAVYFAQVNVESPRYKGLSENPGNYPDSSVEELAGKRNGLSDDASWASISQHWEHSLAALAEEFLNGCVAVTPKQSSTCNYCFVRPVCRIDESVDSSLDDPLDDFYGTADRQP